MRAPTVGAAGGSPARRTEGCWCDDQAADLGCGVRAEELSGVGPPRHGTRACHRLRRPQRPPPFAPPAARRPPPAARRERLPHWCSLADVLRFSEDDLALPLPGVGPEEACDIRHAAGARLVVITLGERGALASLNGVRVTVLTPAVDVVDTVGAGDLVRAERAKRHKDEPAHHTEEAAES
ncbi:PfkB family carbohydrate kinase [Streptomyces sp. WI04-05B]|uniref:PfkB family carbohydrate kinase n=1 Tax=Streptomyces TaxID=1883 RepID=UPI0039F482D1